MKQFSPPPPALSDCVVFSFAQIAWPATLSKRDECKWAGKDFGVSNRLSPFPANFLALKNRKSISQRKYERCKCWATLQIPSDHLLPRLTAKHAVRQMFSPSRLYFVAQGQRCIRLFPPLGGVLMPGSALSLLFEFVVIWTGVLAHVCHPALHFAEHMRTHRRAFAGALSFTCCYLDSPSLRI